MSIPLHPDRIPIEESRIKTDFTCIYRLYNEAGELLYIGTTRRWLVDRLTSHRNSKDWWQEVAYVSVERQPTPWQAVNAERGAIKAERPRYNIRSAVRH